MNLAFDFRCFRLTTQVLYVRCAVVIGPAKRPANGCRTKTRARWVKSMKCVEQFHAHAGAMEPFTVMSKMYAS